MSTIRGKQKNTVEEDFEAFVRRQFNSISDNMKEVKGRIVCNCVNNKSLSVCSHFIVYPEHLKLQLSSTISFKRSGTIKVAKLSIFQTFFKGREASPNRQGNSDSHQHWNEYLRVTSNRMY